MTTQLTDQHNPLSQFMRHPEIFIKLPSQGKFNNPADIQLTPDGELGVSSMTTKDDLTLKSPEGLLNGDSISRVIQSCCPGIKNIRDIPAPDLDAILLAIRYATYGDEMEFQMVCPECGHEDNYEISISNSLESVDFLDDEYFVKLSNEVTVYVKPFTYESSVKESIQKYKEGQAVKMLVDEDLNENPEKAKLFTESLHKLADLMIGLCADSIVKVLDPTNNEMHVTSEQLKEFISFLPKPDADLIQNKIAEINSIGVNKEKTVVCNQCSHKWAAEINFDPSTFFGLSS